MEKIEKIKRYKIKRNRKISHPLVVLLSGFVGGYTVMNFPTEFLKLFSTPIGQFIALLTIIYMYYKDDTDVTFLDIVYESLLYVVILQLLSVILNFIYN